jgi:hypothetical protein
MVLRLAGPAVAAVSEKDPIFLNLMYADAEVSLEHLRGLCLSLQDRVAGAVAIVPALKKIARVFTKTLEKYSGNFSYVNDLARATIKCDTLSVLLAVLRELYNEDSAFAIVLVKNRIMSESDAGEAGGYRDMLLNLRDKMTGHIVELQITLASLLEVKMHGKGGHVAYLVARMVALFNKSVNEHRGAITPDVIRAVGKLKLRVLECAGRSPGLAEHLDGLVAAVKSKCCNLVELTLFDCGWPEGRSVDELLEVVAEQCGDMTKFGIYTDGTATGELPQDLFKKLPKLRTVDFSRTLIAGKIPSSIGCASHLDSCIMWSMKFTGPIPPEIGQLRNLKLLFLSRNQLTGSIPSELGQLRSIEVSTLYKNQLTGSIPSELGQLRSIKTLTLFENQLTGSIPSELGQLRSIEVLTLYKNQLTGSIPPELGQLQSLVHLNLRDSRLVGPIPLELGLLSKLDVLALSNNMLCGGIPPQLDQLHLEELLLSGIS